MELYNGKMCLTHAEITDGIASKSLIDKWNSCGQVTRMRRGCYLTPALYSIDSLPYKYRVEVYRRFPDAKKTAESKKFIDTIEPDGAAIVFFEDYVLPNGKHIDPNRQVEYANDAAILNTYNAMIERANSQRIRQSDVKINKAKFWREMVESLPFLEDKFPNTLPGNPRRLQAKFNRYKNEGYASLVTGKYGNGNSRKVDGDAQESVMMQLMADPRNFDNKQIVDVYNHIGEQLGWIQVTVKAVRERRKKYDLTTAAGRLGATRFRNQREMQVKRTAPTLPLLYWTLDGWTAELLYQKETSKGGHRVVTYHNRLTIVVVLDPCCKYPIGYAIGDHESPELIKAALRDAANHTAQLFGMRYRTSQLQSDRYAIKAMMGTYEVMGEKVTPARAHNSKGKVIEPYFKCLNKKYCQYQDNWAGFGITSDQNNQPNSEFLNKKRHHFPDEEGCRRQLTAIVAAERSLKIKKYMELFAQLPDERKLPLTDEQYLLQFGAETGHRNAIEGQGLRPTIGGIKRDYDCFDPKFREYAHVRWSVKYDPDDLDRVLAVNEDGTLHFMLERKYIQPMALAERKEGDAEQLARVDTYNKKMEIDIAEKLAIGNSKVEQLFLENPHLDIPTRLLLCDSDGQNKRNKQTRRLQAHEIEDVEAVEFKTVKTIATRVDDVDAIELY